MRKRQAVEIIKPDKEFKGGDMQVLTDKELRENFEETKKVFKDLYDIDLNLEDFKKILKEEMHAQEVQREANKITGEAYTCEESNAKCIECSAGLSYVEHSLFGNRCLFCNSAVRDPAEISLSVFILRCLYDFIIYRKLVKILEIKGVEGRIYLCGCLGYLGFRDINQVKTVEDKRKLLVELKNIIRGFNKK